MTGVGEGKEQTKDIPRASNLGDETNSDSCTEVGNI